MNRIVWIAIGTAAPLTLIAYVAMLPTRNECPQYADLVVLHVDQAEADALRAVAAGDRRLLTVNGYTVSAPGFEGDLTRYEYGVRNLESTSDVSCTDARGDLDRNAKVYALAYNRAIQADLPNPL
jgi:hypothetical protein